MLISFAKYFLVLDYSPLKYALVLFIRKMIYRELFRYSVGNLVLPQQNLYLVSGMGPNLVAPTSALPQWILTSRVAIESLGYGVPPRPGGSTSLLPINS